jgi:hypothetical protein
MFCIFELHLSQNDDVTAAMAVAPSSTLNQSVNVWAEHSQGMTGRNELSGERVIDQL